MTRGEHWKDEPDPHDFPAAQSYLSLTFTPGEAAALASLLETADLQHFKAKDLLRASRLALLDRKNAHVASDLEKVEKGARLSPVLLVRGDARSGRPLVVADGYHRICASYLIDEDTDIPCRMVDLPRA